MGVGGSGWECVGVIKSGWEWVGMGGSRWEWVGARFSITQSVYTKQKMKLFIKEFLVNVNKFVDSYGLLTLLKKSSMKTSVILQWYFPLQKRWDKKNEVLSDTLHKYNEWSFILTFILNLHLKNIFSLTNPPHLLIYWWRNQVIDLL